MTDTPALAAKAAETLDLVALTDNPDRQRQLIQQAWEQARRALADLGAGNEPHRDGEPQDGQVTQAAGVRAPAVIDVVPYVDERVKITVRQEFAPDVHLTIEAHDAMRLALATITAVLAIVRGEEA